MDASNSSANGPKRISRFKVVIGTQTFSPIQYHSYQVGQMEIEVNVFEGETADTAYERAIREIEGAIQKHFVFSRRLFFARMPDSAKNP